VSRTTRATIRRIYERDPFPGGRAEWKGASWRLPPLDWMAAVWKREAPIRRILVAGCGTGAEAFSLARRCPRAEIVAVDYSERAIALARASLRRSPRRPPIAFRVADLSHRRLRRAAGRGFDLVTCHGVLSYADEPERWLENLAGVLAPDGALYLGVNGAGHRSEGLRKALAALAIDPAELVDEAEARRALALCDTLQALQGADRVAEAPVNELASDLFGPLIHNLPLSDWTRLARSAGLHLQSSYGGYHELRRVLERDAHEVLWPRTHTEALPLVDALVPERFHRLLFTRQPIAQPPWADRRRLGRWRPRIGALFRVSWKRPVTLDSETLRTRFTLDLTRAGREALRACDGTRTVDDLLAGRGGPEAHELLRLLYGLYQVLAITLDDG